MQLATTIRVVDSIHQRIGGNQSTIEGYSAKGGQSCKDSQMSVRLSQEQFALAFPGELAAMRGLVRFRLPVSRISQATATSLGLGPYWFSCGWLSRTVNIRKTITPMIGMKLIRIHQPLRPVS